GLPAVPLWIARQRGLNRNEAKISHMAHHDALTDLPNRGLMGERLQQSLVQAGKKGTVAVLCLDLDRFKEVNDALGHTVGDTLLKAVADRLRGCVQDADSIARMGGDELVIQQNAATQPFDATSLATRIV